MVNESTPIYTYTVYKWLISVLPYIYAVDCRPVMYCNENTPYIVYIYSLPKVNECTPIYIYSLTKVNECTPIYIINQWLMTPIYIYSLPMVNECTPIYTYSLPMVNKCTPIYI